MWTAAIWVLNVLLPLSIAVISLACCCSGKPKDKKPKSEKHKSKKEHKSKHSKSQDQIQVPPNQDDYQSLAAVSKTKTTKTAVSKTRHTTEGDSVVSDSGGYEELSDYRTIQLGQSQLLTGM